MHESNDKIKIKIDPKIENNLDKRGEEKSNILQQNQEEGEQHNDDDENEGE